MFARRITGVVVVGCLILAGMPSPTLGPAASLSAAPDCPTGLHLRTPLEVGDAYIAALNAADWEAVRCNLDDDAVMISDNGVTNGPDEIIAEFQALDAFAGGTDRQPYQRIGVPVLGGNRAMVRVLYTMDSACVDIPDGIDTLVIKGGRIAGLTTHGFIQFAC